MTGEFAGRVVLVTGGVRGLGKEISRAFATRGAHVIVNYFHATTEAPRVLEELSALGSAELLRGSVADRRQVEALFDAVERRHGKLDVLVNNAAAGALLPLDELDESHWQRALDTNLRGSLWCSRLAAKLMAGSRDPAIVNLSSVGSSLVISDYATVGTSKAAVEALTRYLAVEFAAAGIRVNTASGGLIDGTVATMFPHAAELAQRVREATPLGHRLGSERELAELVVFLASRSASWITGQTVVADGGLSLGSVMLSPKAEPSTSDEPAEDPDAIAVVGMGVVTPGANNPEELWRTLNRREHVFTEPALYDIDSFHSVDPSAEDRTYTRHSGFITGFTPHPRLQAELDDGTVPSRESTTLWLRHSLFTALEGVGTQRGDKFFAAFGYTADGSQELEERLVLSGYLARTDADVAEKLRARYDRLGGSAYEYLPHRVGRNAVQDVLPANTELVMVDTACSSALYGVDLGVKALRDGTADVAVCGGAFAYSARNLVLFSKLHGLSRSGEVRSFDADANGVLFSDGAGVVVLKRLSKAREDGDTVLGIIEGVGLSCDGKGKAIYAPNSAGQAIALRRAYAKSGADPASVGWVIAHATGTQAGDTAEVTSLREVAGDGAAALLSSNKPIIGHTGWTAGLVSLIHGLLGLRHNEVPAQRYLRKPIAALDRTRFTPPMTASALPPGPPRRVAVSSFGFGGTNAHLLLTDQPGDTSIAETTDEDIVVVGWATDLPGMSDWEAVARWLRGQGPAPAESFGVDYPMPEFSEVRLPPATLRNMDRGQIMLMRAAARLDSAVLAACAQLHDTTGIVVGHMGPTRRAVHYALRCYLGDLRSYLGDQFDDGLADAVRALVPPSTEDAFPGIMPNIIPARLAAQADYHGLNVTVDTGPDSGLDALRTAERYLRHGDLDLALVAGVNGNSTPELAEVVGGDRALAEGAFLTVLTRASVAQEHGLPVLARISTTRVTVDATALPDRRLPEGRTYLGADPIVALLALLSGKESGSVSGTQGTRVEVTGPSTVERYARELNPVVPREVRPEIPAIPDNALVIVPDAATLTQALLPPTARVVIMPPAGPAPVPSALAGLLPDGDVPHVRVLARLTDDTDRLHLLHDLAYLAAARWTGTVGSSFAVLLTDAVRAGVPRPETGLFTGLVKSMAREAPDGLSFAVLTEAASLRDGLTTLAGESRNHLELSAVVHSGGKRLEHTLVSAPMVAGPMPIGKHSVVVAAGGGRGLTAEVLTALAEHARPTIYLLGRQSPSEDGDPGPRADFLAARLREDPVRSVTELSAEYDKRRAAAAVRLTMNRLSAHCGEGRVKHLACDLTDAGAVKAAIDHIHDWHDRVDLLINAAGVHHGGTVRATPLADARRVRDTKLLAYRNLRAAFDGRAPGIWHNFGSLLAVLGWQGEADYCSGNDFLNAAADSGDSTERTIAWALWDEAGFAAEPLTRDLLRRRGELTGLSTEEGKRLYLAELASPGQSKVVTFLGEAESRLLKGTPWLGPKSGSTDLQWTPEQVRDGYLGHHLLKGVPTLPGALIAELAVRAAGDGVPVALRDAKFYFPVTSNRACHLRVRDGKVEVLSDLAGPDGQVFRHDLLNAEIGVTFAGRRPEPVKEPLPPSGGEPFVPAYYSPGGLVELSGPFASLGEVRVGQGWMTAHFAPRLGRWSGVFATLTIPALLLDALLQLTLLTRQHGERPPAPVAIDRVDVLTEHNDVALTGKYGDRIVLSATRDTATAQAPDGTVLLRVHGVMASTEAPRKAEMETR
ncbi:SDR family oxidoreductase [Amycolatopsis sp. NPDC059657]|uniref:SDR family oxidoreductase n=1 Tax=Amycolatopsis sp. NPDC059657 TaxID=3346899 RepID=UPI003671EEAD